MSLSVINKTSNPISVYGAGTPYELTNAYAAVVMGTTSPTITLDQPGTYLIEARVLSDYSAATIGGNVDVSVKLRRENNTAADLTGSEATAATRSITATSGLIESFGTYPVVYSTNGRADDVVALYGKIGTAPSSGACVIAEAAIVAIRLNV